MASFKSAELGCAGTYMVQITMSHGVTPNCCSKHDMIAAYNQELTESILWKQTFSIVDGNESIVKADTRWQQ